MILKIAPQELRAPGGNSDFLMELYDMRQKISAAIKKEKEADERKFAREMAEVEAKAAGAHGSGERPLDI